MAHTKGPWKFCKTNGEFIVQGGAVHIDSLHCIFPDVAEVKNRPFESETLSNARLIAAAPELLEALDQARQYIEDDETAHGRKFGTGNAVRAAIAKARGES